MLGKKHYNNGQPIIGISIAFDYGFKFYDNEKKAFAFGRAIRDLSLSRSKGVTLECYSVKQSRNSSSVISGGHQL